MKSALLLAATLAFTTSAALAQTVAPGTTPGAQTGNPSNMPSAGTNDQANSSGRTGDMSAPSRSDKRMMHKNKKTKSSDGSMKTKTKM